MEKNNRREHGCGREWWAFKMLVLLALMAFCCGSNVNEDAPAMWILSDHLASIEEGTCYQQVGQENKFMVSADPGVKYNFINFSPDLAVPPNMVLRFDVCRDSAGEKSISFAVSFTTESGKKFWFSEKISGQWETFTYDFSTAKSDKNEILLPGERFEQISIYARNLKQQEGLNMNFSVRNLQFVVERGGMISEENGIFYSRFPHFQWASQEMESQLLQIARTPDFSNKESLRTVQVPESQYVPKKGLGSGQWYWRYYMRGPLADRWSDIQKFVISERAHDFRLPEIDLQILKEKDHPRLDEHASAQLLDPVYSNLVQFIKTPLPCDPESRWKSSLSKIEWLGKIGDKVVGQTGKRLKNMGTYLMVTNDPALKGPARERLMEMIAWDPEGASSPHANDLSAANVLIGMCWLFDALYFDLTPADRAIVMDAIEVRCKLFAEAGVVPFTLNPAQNHTFKKTEALGVGAIILLGHRESADYWFESVCNIFAYRILPAMGFEGENQEGLSYWRYGGQMIADFADTLKAFCGINLYEHPWLKNTVQFPIYCAPPGGYAISFADQHYYGNHYLRGPYLRYSADKYIEQLTQKTGFPFGAWYLGKPVADSVEQRPPVDAEQSIHWKHIGWTLFNTCLPNGYENVAIGLHSGKYFAGHQHADQNSFVINAYGDKLAIDGGYYDWYGSPHYTAYSKRTIAHNTVLVNGNGQAWRKDGADGIIDTFYSSIPYNYTVGDASDPDIYTDALRLFKRKLLFIKPNYIVIHDQLTATEKPAQFDWLIHSHTDDPMTFDGSNQTFSIVRPLARLDGQFLFPENVGLKVEPSYTVMPSERRSNAMLAEEFIMPEWTLSGTTEPAEGAEEYFVVMRVSKTTDDAPLVITDKFETDTALGVTLRDNGQVIQILSRKAGQKGALLSHKGLVTDADMASVELDSNGTVQRAFIGQGSQLTCNGKPILQQAAVTNAHFNVQEEWHSRQVAPVSLIESLPPFNAYVMQMNNGHLYTYSTVIDLPVDTVFSISLDRISNPVYVHVNGQINPVPASGEFAIKAGPGLLTVSSRSDLSHLRMATQK